jgi:phosphatidylglycerol---prolipoprotein diacylglyceryl transferase
VREPDAGLNDLSWGLTMGQTLTAPMILIGLFLIFRAQNMASSVKAA